MKLMTRIAVTTVLATGFSMAAQAADVNAAPAPAQDPIVQHLKLTQDQVTKIKSLHKQLDIDDRLGAETWHRGRADVLQRHEPGHVLLEAAWAEAASRLTDIARLEALIARARDQLVVSRLDRPSPLSIPVLIQIGIEGVRGLAEAELLAELALG